MRLTVLSVSYPFAPISDDPVGGSEQVLARLDRRLVDSGHISIVVAPNGSEVAGDLLPVPAMTGDLSEIERRRAHEAMRERIAETLASRSVDVVHMHGLDFHAYLPPPGPPVMVSLHLPLDWYPPEALAPARPDTFLHPVSESQARTAPPGARLLQPIANGVRTPSVRARRRGFALTLGRICPEKGQDDALDAAARAGMPLLVAGFAFPYAGHQAFLRERVLPRLDRTRRWIGPVAGHTKERLLAQARCLVIPSKAAETSSLVAMEAMASGTPVVAYRAGALPGIVEHGRTGLLVDIGDIDGLARAMRATEAIDPDLCRATARERFSLARMTGAYLARYAELARRAAA
jgi:glycosyltransferase involved in cell wall biosynthesis